MEQSNGNTVCLSSCTSYDLPGLEEVIHRQFQQLGVYDRLKPGMRVVLKPNLIMKSRPEQAIITHPAVTCAVGLCVQKAGGEVIICESPGGPYTPGVMKSMFRACGYQDMAQAHGFSLYTDCKSREVTLPHARQCHSLHVVEPFLDRDFLIDIAKLKTHGMMGLSAGVKNLFGAVPGLEKPELHCRFPEKTAFGEMLVDLCQLLKPDVTVVDGITAMEGNGPTGGNSRFVGAIVSSLSPYACDVVGAELVGIRPESVFYLKSAMDRGLCPRDLSEISVVGEEVASLAVEDFRPARSASVDFMERVPAPFRPLARKLSTPTPRVEPKKCIGCGKCQESCPQKIISLQEKKARIHPKTCIRCFCCHEMCPAQAISIRRFGLFQC